MGLFDVHAHLTHPRLFSKTAAILGRAQARGVTTIISNGLNPNDNERVRELARRHALVQPAFGFYPVDTVLAEMDAAGVDYPRDEDPVDPEAGIEWLRKNLGEAFAMGEIGLDGHWVPERFWKAQERVFVELVQLAKAACKPIIIHTRKRETRCFELLKELEAERVNWHCFGSKVKLARRIAEHGHFLSIPANARRNQAFTRMLQTLPRDKLLLETDCPYLGPDREHDNEPANVRGTLTFAAELWSVSEDDALAQFEKNFRSLFHADP